MTGSRRRTLVLSHSSSTNALGRAAAMATLAAQLGPVEIVAIDDGPLWAPITQFGHAVVSVTRRDAKSVIERSLDGSGADFPVLWVCKGIRPLDSIVRAVRASRPGVVIIADFDDDDAGLAVDFRRRSLVNRAKLFRLRRMHPKNIRASQTRVAEVADGFTFSTYVLSEAYPPDYRPMLRVPHLRAVAPQVGTRPKRDWEGVRVGFFGTMRPHKGLEVLQRIAGLNANSSVVGFAQSGIEAIQSTGRVVLLDPRTPLQRAYDQVDVALIPVESTVRASALQLPAKLMDALIARVPILATLTPAIEEIAGGVITPLVDTHSDGELLSLIESARNARYPESAWDDALSAISLERTTIAFADFIDAIVSRKKSRA